MIFKANKSQTSYGEAIGILLLNTCTPFIQGDVGNATTYSYPVRYKKIDGLTAKRIFNHDYSFIQQMISGAQELEREGVKAITGDCGFMAIYHKEVKESVNLPVFLSSLLQIPFIRSTIREDAKVGILTANSAALTPEVFQQIGVADEGCLVIRGLQDEKNFNDAVIEEVGTLDSDGIRSEMVSAARRMKADHPKIQAILLECSMMPPYAEAVWQATGLPVYDFVTMIDYVYSAVVKRRFQDVM